jgi:hypothetical protein
MRTPIECAGLRRYICGMLSALALSVAASAGAQEWPEPPEVNGSYHSGDLEKAKKVETFLSCNRDNIYCSDPLAQKYKQRLLESAAAAISRMPDVEGRLDMAPSLIAPSHTAAFHQSVLRCGRNAEMMCFSVAKGAKGAYKSYDLLSNVPAEVFTGDTCKPVVEKACTIGLLSERIDAWNKRNTEEDSNPVLALHDPGFNCLRINSAAMQTVCRDGELSALHRKMLEQLSLLSGKTSLSELPHDRAQVLSDSYWYTSTYGCHNDKKCIQAKIEERIADIAEIATELDAVSLQTAAREAELEAERRLEEIAARREHLSDLMGGVVDDATMPPTSSFRQFEDFREYQRAIKIAEIEKGLSELTGREGRVYRGLWFWSQFRDPSSMRTVFRGNRTVPFTAEEGAFYFHKGYPLERGHSDQIGILTAWVRVYASMCGHLLPTSPDEYRTKTFTTSGPLINRTTYLSDTDILKFQSGLMRPYLASRREFETRQQAAFQGNLWGRASEIMAGGLGAVSSEAQSVVGPYIYAQDDFIRFLEAVGCESPTARQMSQGISIVAHNQSLKPETTGAEIPGAEWVSDMPQAPGEFRLHSEICWNYEKASHNSCGCLVDVAKERLGENDVIPASVDYMTVHEAFMKSPATSQRICRDPLGAISSGLLSSDR